MTRVHPRRFLRFALVVFCVCQVWVASLSSQSSSGTLSGRVTDSSGALVAGAQVALRNKEQGTTATVFTNDIGSYTFASVTAGHYRITVTKRGFKEAQVEDLTMNVQGDVSQSFALELGAVSETVTVNAAETLVNTVNSTMSSVVTGAPIENLPLNGRDTLQLALTQPGVTPSALGAGQFSGLVSIGGGRDNAVTYLLDGGTNTSATYGIPVVDPNPDTVGEYRVLTNNYTAEFGRSGGGVVSVITKSGTNDLHGSAYDYLRNEDFNANTFFNNESGLTRPVLKRNQFGGTIGGPVLIPRLFNGKDKVFFFFGYQGQRQTQTQVNPQVTTYTPAELNGDFSNASPSVNAAVASFLTANPFFQANPQLAAEGIIDPSKINPVAESYIKNGLIPTSASGILTPNGKASDNRDEFIGKLDLNLTSNDRLSFTAVSFNNPQDYPFVTSGAPNVAGYPGDNIFTNMYATIGYTKSFSAAIINEFHFTAQHDKNSLNFPAANLPGPSQLGVNVTPDSTTGPTQILFDQSGTDLGFNINGPAIYADTTYVYADTLAWVHGAHTIKMGGTASVVENNAWFAFAVDGAYDFYGSGSGSDLADFLLGLPTDYYQYPRANSAVRSQQYATFIQDEWKLKPNLTLSFGLRYEYSTPKSDPRDRNYMIVPGKQSVKFPNAPLGLLFPGDPGAPSNGVNYPDRNDVAPRFGLAWDPTHQGKMSIRTGFGVFYDVLLAQDNQNQNGTPPFYSAAYVPFTTPSSITGTVPFLSDPFGSTGTTNPFPSHAPPSNLNFATAGFLPFGPSSVFIDPNLRTPYIYQYNLSIQRQLSNGLAAEVGYMGSSSHKLVAQKDIDPFIVGSYTRILNAQPGLQIPGAYGQMPYTFGNNSSANYNSLIASLTKRINSFDKLGQVFFTAAYTYAHNLDTADGFARNSNAVGAYDWHDFIGPADSDIRQRFVLSGGWELPFNKLFPNAPKRLTSGWELFPIFTMQTGFPYNVSAGLYVDGATPGPSGAGDNNLVRPDILPGAVASENPSQVQTFTVNGSPVSGHFFFNPSSLYTPACYASYAPPGTPGGCPAPTYGNLARNFFRGPGLTNLDIALEKRTKLYGEKVQLIFRAEFFNAFNHTEWQSANSTVPITSPQVGQITSTLDPRIGQMALRVSF